MFAKGMTTRQVSDIIEDIYGFEFSESMVTAVTNKILPQIEQWHKRPLSFVYPIVFIAAIHFSVSDEHIVKKIAAYIILGINDKGKKEVQSITIGENESAKYWLKVRNRLKKSRCTRYTDFVCRRIFRHQGVHSYGVSKYGISAVYRASGTKHIKIR